MEIVRRLRDYAGLVQSGRAAILLSALVAAGIGATAGLLIWHEHQAALEEHEHAMSSTGVVVAEQTARHAQVIDLILRDVQARISSLDVASRPSFGDMWERLRYTTTLPNV